MLTSVSPKLPMRNKELMKNFYLQKLNFVLVADYSHYLILAKDKIEIHFFLFKDLEPKENYGQVYIRTTAIEEFYQSLMENETEIHPNGPLEKKVWGQKEFSLLDPDHNLLTFGEVI